MNLHRTTWPLASPALSAGTVAVAWSAVVACTAIAGETRNWLDSFQWSDWQLIDEVVKRDGEPFAGWQSMRAMREVDSLLAKAIVVPVEHGAECLLSYNSFENWDGNPAGVWKRYMPVGATAHIFTFPALPQALQNCRDAIDRKLAQQSASRESGREETP